MARSEEADGQIVLDCGRVRAQQFSCGIGAFSLLPAPGSAQRLGAQEESIEAFRFHLGSEDRVFDVFKGNGYGGGNL